MANISDNFYVCFDVSLMIIQCISNFYELYLQWLLNVAKSPFIDLPVYYQLVIVVKLSNVAQQIQSI